MFDNNFSKCGPIFVRKFSMCTSQRFPPHLQYVATLPCESQKSKNVTDFDSTATVLAYSCEHFEDLI